MNYLHGFSQQNYCEGHICSGHIVFERLVDYNGRKLCSTCKAGAQYDLKQSHKTHRKIISQLNENVNLFATQNSIEIKCISDKIQLYYRYSVSVVTQYHEIDPTRKDENTKLVLEECDRIYHHIRGDMRFTNKNPRTVAGAIVYIACVMTNTKITQHEVAVSLDMTEKAIRDNYFYLKSALKL